MNTIQLQCFVAVAEHLNFSRASEDLKMTQPAIRSAPWKTNWR